MLLFVFRDRTKTPLARLVETWGEDLQRMWAAIAKPPEYESTRVEDFFEVRYTKVHHDSCSESVQHTHDVAAGSGMVATSWVCWTFLRVTLT